MTLQTSGAISLSQIQTEFGGSNPISLSEYYAGGANVAAGTSGTNGAVPSSGAIAMSKFYGTSDISITIPSATQDVLAFAVSPTQDQAHATFSIGNLSAGNYGYSKTPSFSPVSLGIWITPQSEASNYEAYATQTGASGSSVLEATLNTWLSLNQIRYFGVSRKYSQYGLGTASRTFSIQVRKIGTTTIVGTFTAYCEVTNQNNL